MRVRVFVRSIDEDRNAQGAHGPRIKATQGLGCSASPKPAGCPFIRLDDEVDIYWELYVDGSGGNLSAPTKLPVTANLPEANNNPYNYITSECAKSCPAGSTDDMNAATASNGTKLYCNPLQACGARVAYFSFHPGGAQKIVWDPTVVGLAEVPPQSYIDASPPTDSAAPSSVPSLSAVFVSAVIALATAI